MAAEAVTVMTPPRDVRPGKLVLGAGLGLALIPWVGMFLLWLWILIGGYLAGGEAARQTWAFQALAALTAIAAAILAVEMSLLLVWRLVRRD